LLLEQEHAVKVREKMTANPACCSPEDTSEAAARMMEQKDCGCARRGKPESRPAQPVSCDDGVNRSFTRQMAAELNVRRTRQPGEPGGLRLANVAPWPRV
jgi:hypothetical protein